MTTTDRSTVVGVFSDDAQAQQAINALRQVGFSDDQISYSGHGTSSGGFLAGLKSFFTGEDYAAGGAYDDLVGMGMPEEDAHSREVKCALQVAVEVIRYHLPASSFSLSLHPSAVTTSA